VLLAFVVRLDARSLAKGRLAGEVEVVATGARAVIRNLDEFLAFVYGSSPEQSSGVEASAGGERRQEGR
jgi:hypothetical protein